MLAHHPITGAPIKILKTETHLYKNKKTLVWLRTLPTDHAHPVRFQRWDTFVTDVRLAEAWKTCLGDYPSAIVLREPTADIRKWLENAPRQKQLLFLSKCVMDAYTPERFHKDKFINVICLDELGEMFPHIYRACGPKDPDVIVALCISVVFRASRLIGVNKHELDSVLPYMLTIKEAYSLEALPMQEPEPLTLIQQYYEPANAHRSKEIKHCLEMNLLNPCIDKVILLNEKRYSLPKSPKISEVILGHRLKYSDMIKYIKEHGQGLVVFSNSDIYLDKSWNQLWSIKMEDTFLSLLRYETQPEGGLKLFGPRPDSQDTWVVHSDSIKSRTWDYSTLNFEFGRAGCDNAINVEMLKKKFVVANPCLSLQTIHCHGSEYRTYNPHDVVDKPMYLYLDHTGLHDLEPMRDLSKFEVAWPQAKPFSRRVYSADPKALRTFCAMVTREEDISYAVDSANTFTPAEEKLYKFSNAFMTPNGLLYSYKSIYLGNTEAMREAWASTPISHITPCLGVKSTLGVPLDNETASNVFAYLTLYLSRIFRLRESYEGDFWLPRTNRLQDFLQFFKWNDQVLPVLPRDESVASFAETATMLPPRSEIHKEDIAALRSMLKNYQPTLIGKKAVIIQNDKSIDSEETVALEKILEANGYDVDIVYIYRSSPSYLIQRFIGASLCISPQGCEDLWWLLPEGAKVIDVLPELKLKSTGSHMAGACGLEYWVTLMPRAKKEQHTALLVKKVLATLEATKPKTVTLPKIIVPSKREGYHSHAGDSFREMVSLWSEQGRCQIEQANTNYVWFGAVGETLLYDRANFNWLERDPEPYKKLLCGNPDASLKQAQQWTFWPRHPKLVEKLAHLSNQERKHTLVFYGRIENSIQEENRANDLWKACDEYDCPTSGPYKYGPAEYLKQLANSKFGLCMAGYGPKCNREVECMALGTVPVVAPQVDMTNYANPPQEGVHYLRLDTTDSKDVPAKLAITDEKWLEMSKACHEWWLKNASAEGLWTLTENLALC